MGSKLHPKFLSQVRRGILNWFGSRSPFLEKGRGDEGALLLGESLSGYVASK